MENRQEAGSPETINVLHYWKRSDRSNLYNADKADHEGVPGSSSVGQKTNRLRTFILPSRRLDNGVSYCSSRSGDDKQRMNGLVWRKIGVVLLRPKLSPLALRQ